MIKLLGKANGYEKGQSHMNITETEKQLPSKDHNDIENCVSVFFSYDSPGYIVTMFLNVSLNSKTEIFGMVSYLLNILFITGICQFFYIVVHLWGFHS